VPVAPSAVAPPGTPAGPAGGTGVPPSI
jgi:hypothetical protein